MVPITHRQMTTHRTRMVIHCSNTKSDNSSIYGIWSPNIYTEPSPQGSVHLLGNISCDAAADPLGSRAPVLQYILLYVCLEIQQRNFILQTRTDSKLGLLVLLKKTDDSGKTGNCNTFCLGLWRINHIYKSVMLLSRDWVSAAACFTQGSADYSACVAVFSHCFLTLIPSLGKGEDGRMLICRFRRRVKGVPQIHFYSFPFSLNFHFFKKKNFMVW